MFIYKIKDGFVLREREDLDSLAIIPDSDRASEDAVLFAAAPELLALLIEIVSELSDTDEEGLIEHTEWMMKARATIAKAKGE